MEEIQSSAPSRSPAPAHTLAAPLAAASGEIEPAPLAFELEDEDVALLGRTDDGEQYSADAAEPMPLWVVPLLTAAVRPPTSPHMSAQTPTPSLFRTQSDGTRR